MNTEAKGVLQVLAFTLPLFGIMVFGWLSSPMYADVKAAQRQNAQEYLIETYFFPDNPSIDRKGMIEDYGFIDEEINPNKVLGSLLDAQSSSDESR